MTKNELFAALDLAPDDKRSVVRWCSNPAGPVTASARLDAIGDGNAEQYEFGVYETIDGETHYVTGRVFIRPSGDVRFPDDRDENIFERFAETIRTMVREDDLGAA
jgi:Mor family transcriptional regulator